MRVEVAAVAPLLVVIRTRTAVIPNTASETNVRAWAWEHKGCAYQGRLQEVTGGRRSNGVGTQSAHFLLDEGL